MNLFEKRAAEFEGRAKLELLVKVGIICDYCGEVIVNPYEHRTELTPDLAYKVIEGGNVEEWFYEMGLISDGKPVDLHDLFRKHDKFVFCQNFETGTFCEVKAIQDALNRFERGDAQIPWEYPNWGIKDPRHLFFADIMYTSRLTMLQRLFDEKKRSLEDFNLVLKAR